MATVGLWRDRGGFAPNTGAIVAAFGGWGLGLALIVASSPWLNALGVVLLALAMTISGYLVHDCAHATVFRKPEHNALLGELLGWVCGSCYSPFESIRMKHLIHHSDRLDNVSFDYRPFLRQYPLVARIVKVLEWAHIPAIDLMMHASTIVAPFCIDRYARNRGRVIVCLAVRGAAFVLLGYFSAKSLLLYGVSYLLFLHVLRFVDAFQHTYELAVVDIRDD